MPHAVTLRKLAPVLFAEAIEILLAERPELLERLRDGAPLGEVADAAVGLSDVEREYFEAMPRAVTESIRGALLAAIDEKKDVNIQFSPAYDFDVRVWDYGEAVGIHVGGPYAPRFAPERFRSER